MHTLLKSSVADSSKKVLLRWWKNAWGIGAPLRGTVFLLHGIGEHSGRYDEFARYLCNWGFDVVSFDYPGHGASARKGAFERFADFPEMLADAQGIFKYWLFEGPDSSHHLHQRPVYLMGHSMGALLTLYWLVSRSKVEEGIPDFSRILVSAPPLQLALEVPIWKDMVAQHLHKVMPDLKLGNEIDASFLSHDEPLIYSYQRDRLRSSKASPRLYLSLKESMKVVRDRLLDISLPLMIISGKEDPIINHQVLEEFYQNLNTHKKWIAFDAMKHETLNEIDREKVYQEVLKWFLV